MKHYEIIAISPETDLGREVLVESLTDANDKKILRLQKQGSDTISAYNIDSEALFYVESITEKPFSEWEIGDVIVLNGIPKSY